ncbi:MAG: Gfo/Idh/MocA family oxidoreductase [Lachnospiraceae bacterium]|nr:Gfo/Idh/MocA family oxidoreductase [Lachnospiraceae bacterium]
MIRIALAGCGCWGNTVLKAILRTPGIELVSVYDKNPKQLEQVRRAYGNSFSYAGNYQELLDDASIDAVALTVSTGAHFEMAEQALFAGKHIFIEKPFTETLEQAERLYELAKEKDCLIHVDHIMLYHPAVRKMKELLEKKSLGEIRYIEMRRTSFGGERSDITVLQDLTVHDLSIIDYLTDGAEPVVVRSIGEKLGYSHTSIAFTLLKYPGFSAELTASWVSPVKERKICLGGTEKTLVFDEIFAPDKLMIYNNDTDDLRIIKPEAGNALDNSLEHFCACVDSGTNSLTDAASAIRIMKILITAQIQILAQL